MRITRIYQDIFLEHSEINEKIILDNNASHYLSKVMRCTVGDFCCVFDGYNHEFKAEIILINKNNIEIKLLEKMQNLTESNLKIHLVQGLCKGDKMDLIIQKSIELGVTEITPIFSQYCDIKLNQERIEKKMQHWKKIMISATEQSGRAVLAKLNYPKNFHEIINIESNIKHQFLLSPRAELNFKNINFKIQNINDDLEKNDIKLFIGPEGGFSDSEENQAIKANIQLLKLGPRILRTETAGLAIISAFQAHWGDFYE